MTLLDAYLEPIAACFTPEVARRLVNAKPDLKTESRLEYLREKANEGTLSAVEQEEYEEFVETLDFVALLKAKARAMLKSNDP